MLQRSSAARCVVNAYITFPKPECGPMSIETGSCPPSATIETGNLLHESRTRARILSPVELQRLLPLPVAWQEPHASVRRAAGGKGSAWFSPPSVRLHFLDRRPPENLAGYMARVSIQSPKTRYEPIRGAFKQPTRNTSSKMWTYSMPRNPSLN